MNKLFSRLPESASPQARLASRISIIMLVSVAPTALLYFFLALRMGAWQMFVAAAAVTIYTGVCLTAISQAQRGRHEWVAQALIFGILGGFLAFNFVIEGFGLTLGVTVALIAIAISGQLLTQQLSQRVLMITILGGMLMVLFDIFAPEYRLQVPQLRVYVPGLLGVLVLVYAVMVVRNRVFLSKFLGNISVAWKMILMVSVLFLGTLGVAAAGYIGLQSMQYQFSNIYDFMLVPITSIQGAGTSLEEAQRYLVQAASENTTAQERNNILAQVQAANQAAEKVMTRYDTEWVTTISPQFTQDLKNAGKIGLQQQELADLAAYHKAYDSYKATFAQYLATVQAGSPDANLVNNAITQLPDAQTQLQSLIDVNLQFADFSNTSAQAALQQALLTGVIVLIIGLVLGVFLSYLIVISITGRLGDLTHSAAAMQEGNLDQTVSVTGRDEVSLLGATFNSMASQLKNLFSTLEQRVADRTKALATSAEVSRRLSTATSPRQLAVDVVEQVQSAFNYYHAHIYFLDEASGDLIMAGGTGEAGATLLARGHKVPKGRGLVGRAAVTNSPMLVPDVSQTEDWLPNPLLPDTQSEVAIPISSASQVLGVLDVQQNVVNGLSEVDVELLQSLAGQVAISLQNARTFEESRAKAELELMVNTIGQKIQKTTSVEDTLQTAIREIGTALGASRVSASIQSSRRPELSKESIE